MQTENRQSLLAERPKGAPTAETFSMVTTTIPEPGEGELRTRTIYLSLDPYMRGRMNAERSYAEPVAVGDRGVVQGPSTNDDKTRVSVKFDPPAGLWNCLPDHIRRTKDEPVCCPLLEI